MLLLWRREITLPSSLSSEVDNCSVRFVSFSFPVLFFCLPLSYPRPLCSKCLSPAILPAKQVHPWDVIMSVDGESVKGFRVVDIKRLIAGEEGSKVSGCTPVCVVVCGALTCRQFQCYIVVLLSALARNVWRVFGSFYKATSVTKNLCVHM